MFHLKKRFWKSLRPHHFILIVTSGEAATTSLVRALLQVKTYLTVIVAGSKDALALEGFLKPDLLVLDDSHRANERGDLSGWLSITQTFKEVPTIILSSQLALSGEGERGAPRPVHLPKTIQSAELLATVKRLLTEASSPA